jgi:hypothetical protein
LKSLRIYEYLSFWWQPSAFSLQPSAFGSQSSAFSPRKWIYGIFIAALVLSSCGYQFSGGGNLPGGIQRVFVSQLDNRTAETGLENTFSNDLRYEFIRYNRSANSDVAEAVLSGTVKSLWVETISRSEQHSSLERRVTISVDLKLTDKNGKVLWFVEGLADSESYRVESGSQATDANKRAAVSAIAKRLAENVYYRLTDNF